MKTGIHTLTAWMAAAGLLAGLSGTTQAQQLQRSWYLTPQVSAFDPDNSYGTSGTGRGASLLLGRQVSDNFDLQMLLGHSRRSELGNKTQQTLLGVDAVFVFNRGEWQPIFFMGVGAERDERTLAGVATSGTSPYASAGAGLRWMFKDNLGVQVDYRRVEGFLRDAAKWGFNRSGNNYVNVGLVWTFGGELPRPPVVAAAPPPAPAPKIVAAPSPPVVAPPPPPPPPPPPQRITIAASELFELNSARLSKSVAALDAFAAAMNSNPQIGNVAISGHTDQLGSEDFNRGLSQRRADAVKAYLVKKGIAAGRLTAQGMGSGKLVTDCKETTRAAMITCGTPNRRVEIEPITVPK